MEKIYNPCNIERVLYEEWEQRGYFKPNDDKTKESFCIVIPPPNITGSLHMGHAFQQTIMDIIVRYQRMQGKKTLWQVGTDHAGIATQIVVERKIAKEENKTRHDYGRFAFIEKIWKWKLESSKTIKNQMRRLGNSIDWDRERFTMDEGFSNVVKKVFIHLYKENLIYRSKRLVNWDSKLYTAISDLEVENRELKGYMWYICYPLANSVKSKDGKDYLVVATTRPETLLGDTAVAVNPDDSRYIGLIGKFVILPILNRLIPIIGDKHVDMKKGTGCMKITPAHDFDDYEIGRRHQLPMINIFTLNGYIRKELEIFDTKGNKSCIYSTEIPAEFQKLERFSARRAIVAAISSLGLLEKIKPYNLTVPYNERSGIIIEPMLTNQWYIRTNILAKQAIKAVKDGDIQFIPKQYENMYFSWMHNIQDWCISRQIWWGHQIPAWYDKQGNVYVGFSKKEIYKENNLSSDIILCQDEDVLDTWFSSAIWTFSTLGWPQNIEILHQFHPTNIVVSGFDIIFFWIARMIMITMYLIRDKDDKPQVPFKIAYITGLIRDDKGKKMSKSKGNVIDPLDIIDGISLEKLVEKRIEDILQPHLKNKVRKHTEKYFPNGINPYGADALRLTLAALASTSRNINWDMNRLEGYRNFCNKQWNASRFVLMNTENKDCGFNGGKKVLSLIDRWILSEFNKTIKLYREALDKFRFDVAVNILYEFTWNQFCDWYIELTKVVMSNGSEEELRGTRHTLVTVLEALLRLAHPIIPFITETIWKRVKVIVGIKANTIMLQQFPEFNSTLIDDMASADTEWLKQAIIAIRNIRIKMNISSHKLLNLFVRNCSSTVIRRIIQNKNFFENISCLKSITLLPNNDIGPVSIVRIIDNAELLIPIADCTNKAIKADYLEKEIKKIEKEIIKTKSKLLNENFISRAPKTVIKKEQEKLTEYTNKKERLLEQKKIFRSLKGDSLI